MKNQYPLYLGSKSYSRKMLLEQSGIPFMVVNQDANEAQCNWSLSLAHVTASIADYKMQHVLLPDACENDVCIVLTADTLSQDIHHQLHGKPTSLEDARTKLVIARQGMETGTSFFLEKRIYRNGAWHCMQQVKGYAVASYTFDVPDDWIDHYFAQSIGLSTSGAIAIEQFGTQFLKEVRGSYSAIVGLPMYEVRQALTTIGFFG